MAAWANLLPHVTVTAATTYEQIMSC
eukprot:COSAG03_NODE_26304_length_260_cov_0.602484_1_plen_25_part_01